MPKVIAHKLSLPTLWVDTSVGIKLAKLRRGEGISEIEERRLSRLKECVTDLVRNCRLLCSEGDQEWEYCENAWKKGFLPSSRNSRAGFECYPIRGCMMSRRLGL